MATNKKTAKKVISKSNHVKPGAKQVKKAAPSPKKQIGKTTASQKVKSAKPLPKKAAAPIKKSQPVKKSAKPAVKSAAPIKLNTTKKVEVPSKKLATPPTKSKALPVKKQPVSQSKSSIKATPETKSLPKAKDIKVPPPKAVVLPKITSTRSRKYEPEFTKSVLDQPTSVPTGPTMRYSDHELIEFKELIQRKVDTAKKELGYLQGLITRKDEMGGDDTDNRYMTMEDGSLSMEREQLSQMASRQITFIDHLEKAMMRIENKTYGICRVTGKLIDKARLRAVPHATLSIEAKMGNVR